MTKYCHESLTSYIIYNNIIDLAYQHAFSFTSLCACASLNSTILIMVCTVWFGRNYKRQRHETKVQNVISSIGRWSWLTGKPELLFWLSLFTFSRQVYYFDHATQLQLYCSNAPNNLIGKGQLCTEGDVRLVAGPSTVTRREGTVQVCINSMWGVICNSGWDSREAGVVCRQLGLPSLGEHECIWLQSLANDIHNHVQSWLITYAFI